MLQPFTAFRVIRTLFALIFIILGIPWGQNGLVSAQDAVTSSVTETFVEIHIVISTVTATLSSCPCPSSTLGIGPGLPTTTTFLGAPPESAVVVQLYFTLPAQIASTTQSGSDNGGASTASTATSTPGGGIEITYLLNRNNDEAVVDSVPLALYLGSDGDLSQASDIAQRIYFSLPASITNGKLFKRFDNILPVSIGDDPGADAVFNGFVEGADGYFYFNITTSQGTFVLGFTICPTDGTDTIGQRVYMYDIADTPALSECLTGSAKKWPYSDYASGSLSGIPAPTESGSLTGFPTGDGGSTQNTQGTGGGTGGGGTAGTQTGSGTDAGGGTITTGPTATGGGGGGGGGGGEGGGTSGDTTTGGNSGGGNGSSGDNGGGSNGSNGGTGTGGNGGTTSGGTTTGRGGGGGNNGGGGSGGGGGGGGFIPPYHTDIIYTSALTTGSSVNVNQDAKISTVYLPYPSSLKIVDTLHGDEVAKDVSAYLGKFLDLPLGLPSTPEKDVFYYRLFELDSEGHLCVPIPGPSIVSGAWNGKSANEVNFARKCAYNLPGNTASYVGSTFKLATLSEGESANGKLLKFTMASGTNVLTLDSTVNVTAGYELWICDSAFGLLGITDGVAPGCNYDKVTGMVLWGNQETVNRGQVYGFVAAVTTETLSIGEGPSIVIQTVRPKSLFTETTTVTDPTDAAGYGVATVGTGLDDPSATVVITKARNNVYLQTYWSLTGTRWETLRTISATGPTMYVEVARPPITSLMFTLSYRYPFNSGNTRFIPLAVTDAYYPTLQTYGIDAYPSGGTLLSTVEPAVFWLPDSTENYHWWVLRQRGVDMLPEPEPLYAYWVESNRTIIFKPYDSANPEPYPRVKLASGTAAPLRYAYPDSTSTAGGAIDIATLDAYICAGNAADSQDASMKAIYFYSSAESNTAGVPNLDNCQQVGGYPANGIFDKWIYEDVGRGWKRGLATGERTRTNVKVIGRDGPVTTARLD
ncbi:hypothetical protein TWF281_003157 [Arthrobotrys megalospora]